MFCCFWIHLLLTVFVFFDVYEAYEKDFDEGDDIKKDVGVPISRSSRMEKVYPTSASTIQL